MLGMLIGAMVFAGLLTGLNRLFNANELTNPYECGFHAKEANVVTTTQAH